MPNAFVIACLLTLVVFALVIAVAGKDPIAAQGYWVKGFWELLELAMQMSLIVLTGYVVAVSPAVSRLLELIAGLATSPRGAVALMGLVSMGASWLHWGLGSDRRADLPAVPGPQHPRIDYRLAVAAGYLGSTCTWHAGLSGSAPLLMATPKNFMEAQAGLIPISTTTFSAFNLVLTAVVVAVMTATVRRLYPREADVLTSETSSARRARVEVPRSPRARPCRRRAGGSRWRDALEHRYWLNLVMGLLGDFGPVDAVRRRRLPHVAQRLQFRVPVSRAAAAPEPGQLHARGHARRDLPPRHRRSVSVLRGDVRADPVFGPGRDHRPLVCLDRQPEDVSGHHLLVFGDSQLLHPVGRIEVGRRGAVCRVGGAGARRAGLACDPGVRLGDMSTHFLQPFWAIPLLAIARVEFKDIVGYLALLFVVNLVVVSTAFLLMPYIL